MTTSKPSEFAPKMSTIMKISIFFVCVIISAGVYAMSLSDLGKVCLFSKISGVITLDGKPAAGAKLIRTANRDDDITDETTTDEKGYFEFPAMFERTFTKYIPQEFVASQEITVHHQGKEYGMWSGVKRKPEENIEGRGEPIIVTCELNSEKKYINIGASFFHSLCEWNVESDPQINWDDVGFFDKD